MVMTSYPQNLCSMVYIAEMPITEPVLVEFNRQNLLTPCNVPTNAVGVANVSLEPNPTTLRAEPSVGPLNVIHKGLAECKVVQASYTLGQPLTLDTNGVLKALTDSVSETLIARAAETKTADIIKIFLL